MTDRQAIHHLCGNPSCTNVAHLERVMIKEKGKSHPEHNLTAVDAERFRALAENDMWVMFRNGKPFLVNGPDDIQHFDTLVELADYLIQEKKR